MRRAVTAILLALAAGCALAPPEGPTIATGTQTGESGDPRNRARIHTELAALYYGRGSMAVALEELRVAVAADESYAQAHAMFGIVYMDLRENRLAQASFERALELSPTDPDINHNFGWFLCQTGRAPDSARYFLQAVKNPLYPTPWRSYAAAGVCALRTNNVKDADDYFQRALKLEPDEPTALLQLGQIRYRQNNLEEARRLVSRVNRLLAPTAESLWLAVRIERKLGERAAEQSYAIQLRRRFPSSAEFQALQRGEYDK
jgi:type IV pilus assembly protein PilF